MRLARQLVQQKHLVLELRASRFDLIGDGGMLLVHDRLWVFCLDEEPVGKEMAGVVLAAT